MHTNVSEEHSVRTTKAGTGDKGSMLPFMLNFSGANRKLPKSLCKPITLYRVVALKPKLLFLQLTTKFATGRGAELAWRKAIYIVSIFLTTLVLSHKVLCGIIICTIPYIRWRIKNINNFSYSQHQLLHSNLAMDRIHGHEYLAISYDLPGVEFVCLLMYTKVGHPDFRISKNDQGSEKCPTLLNV